jgi:hypothetical protein
MPLTWTKQVDGSYTEPSGRLKIALWKQTRRYRLFEGGDGTSHVHTGSLASCKRRAETLVTSLEALPCEPLVVPVPAAEQRTKAKKAGNASEPLSRTARSKAVDVQEAVNKLVLRHGRNVHEWADWPDLLAKEGVDPAAVTDRILQLARDAAVLAEFVGPDETEAENLRTPDGFIWSLEPIYEEWAASSVYFWPSECGRYRLCRITDNDGRSVYYGAEVRVLDRWDAIGHSPLGPGYPKKHDSLEAAAKAALKYHCDKFHLEGCPTNADELLASVRALVESLEGPPEPAQPDDEGEMMATKTRAAKAETLKVPELAARKLLTALGSEGAAEQDGGKYVWSRSKLLTSLKALPSDRAECDPVSGADAELLDRIEAALKGGGQVEVVPEGEEEKAVETKTKKASKPKAVKKEAQPARNGKASGRPKVLGAYSAGPFARWLGRQGVGAEDARRIMEGAGGCPLSDASLKWELKEVREAKPPAPVSREHAKELKAKWPEAFGARKAGAGK